MSLTFHIAAQATTSAPQPLQRDAPFVNLAFEFATLPPVHTVVRACEAIFSSLFALTTAAAAPSDAAHETYFLVESVLFFDEFSLCWCELMSAVQLHPGIQLFCLSPTQGTALPPASRSASLALLEVMGKQLLPAPEDANGVRWPSAGEDWARTWACARGPVVPAKTGRPPAVQPTDRSLYESDELGRSFSTRVREVFAALDSEKRTFLLLRDFYDFAARYTLPRALLARLQAPPCTQVGPPTNTTSSTGTSPADAQTALLSPRLDENLVRLRLDGDDALSSSSHRSGPSHACSPRLADAAEAREGLALTRTCDLDAIIREADTDRDGRLSLSEWTHYCLHHPRVLDLFELHLHPSRLQALANSLGAATTTTASRPRRPSHARSAAGASPVLAPAAAPAPASTPATAVSVQTQTTQSTQSAKTSPLVQELGDQPAPVRTTEQVPTSGENGENGDGTDGADGADGADGGEASDVRLRASLASLAARPQRRHTAPTFTQRAHVPHRCYFRHCAACAAARDEEAAAITRSRSASLRGDQRPTDAQSRRPPWNYRSGRPSLVPQGA